MSGMIEAPHTLRVPAIFYLFASSSFTCGHHSPGHRRTTETAIETVFYDRIREKQGGKRSFTWKLYQNYFKSSPESSLNNIYFPIIGSPFRF